MLTVSGDDWNFGRMKEQLAGSGLPLWLKVWLLICEPSILYCVSLLCTLNGLRGWNTSYFPVYTKVYYTIRTTDTPGFKPFTTIHHVLQCYFYQYPVAMFPNENQVWFLLALKKESTKVMIPFCFVTRVAHASVIFWKLVLHSVLHPVLSNFSNVISNDEIVFYNHLRLNYGVKS